MTNARGLTTVSSFACLLLSACGGGGGSGDTGGGTPPPPASFSVGGNVTGLAASGLVLQNNGASDLAISASGAFTFPTSLASGAAYAVTIKSQPSVGPAQNCTVSSGSGSIGSASVTTVSVTCTTQVAKFLYVPNRGSNDVSVYSIAAATGALTEVAGSPFAADQSPSGATANRAGTYLYAVNWGSLSAPPRISAYAINAATGALAEVVNSPFDLTQTAPLADGPEPGIGKLVVHPSGAFGYIAIQGIPVIASIDSSKLYGATVATPSGELLEIPGFPVTVGSGMGVLTFNASGTVLYVPHNDLNGTGAAIGAVSVYSVNAPSGVLTRIGAYATGGDAPVIAVLNPAGKLLFVANLGSASVSSFTVDAAVGTLTAVPGGAVSAGAGASVTSNLVVHPTKNFVYATNVNGGATGSISAFKFDATTGVLTPIVNSPFSTGGNLALLGSIDPSGKFFFVSNRNSSSIAGFAIDQTTGALTPVPGSPLATSATPSALIIDPSGKYLYVSGNGANVVSSYSINATTGALTLVGTKPTGVGPAFAEIVGLQ